jgi:hypothetical protein
MAEAGQHPIGSVSAPDILNVGCLRSLRIGAKTAKQFGESIVIWTMSLEATVGQKDVARIRTKADKYRMLARWVTD